MSDSIAVSKLNERVSQHDVEFAEIRGAIKSISGAATETKESVKAIYSQIQKTNELMHKSQLKDEIFMQHLENANERFQGFVNHCDEKRKEVEKRVDTLESDRKKVFMAMLIALAIGVGGVVADYYFKPRIDTVILADDTDK